MTLNVELDFSEVERYAKRLGQNSELIDQELRRAMTESVITVEGQVVTRTPVNFGTLRQSISHSVRGQGIGIIGEVATPSAYGLPVEFGRKPGKFPPLAPIELWVRRKLNVPEAQVESVAFLVARKIARSGTKGAFMFRDGLEASGPQIAKSFDQATKRIVDRMSKL